MRKLNERDGVVVVPGHEPILNQSARHRYSDGLIACIPIRNAQITAPLERQLFLSSSFPPSLRFHPVASVFCIRTRRPKAARLYSAMSTHGVHEFSIGHSYFLPLRISCFVRTNRSKAGSARLPEAKGSVVCTCTKPTQYRRAHTGTQESFSGFSGTLEAPT